MPIQYRHQDRRPFCGDEVAERQMAPNNDPSNVIDRMTEMHCCTLEKGLNDWPLGGGKIRPVQIAQGVLEDSIIVVLRSKRESVF